MVIKPRSIKRDMRFEAYRVFCMLVVCLYHVLVHGKHNCILLQHFAGIGVVGFMSLSGWFGIREFSWNKALKLCMIGVYGALLSTVCLSLTGKLENGFLADFIHAYHDYWFLHAYLICMALAPIINVAINQMVKPKNAVKLFLPLLMVVFVWAFAGELRHLQPFVPASPGLTRVSGLTLIGIYVATRLLRIYSDRFLLNMKVLIGLLIGLLIVVMFGHFGFYDSPFLLAEGCVILLLISKVNFRMPYWMERILVFMAPSIFAIYTIHETPVGRAILRTMYEFLYARIGVVGAIPVAIAIFILAFLCDMPRRLISRFIKSH